MSKVAGRRAEKARDVREMFGAIARHYDLLNHVLSLNVDRRWRRGCVREVSKRLASPQPAILDVGCGTGDLSLAFSLLGPVAGCDFCHPMLQIGRDKISRFPVPHPISLLEGDALALPFRDCRFDVVVSAFVLRNLTDAQKGLQEMRRVLRGGGVLGVLDFSMPKVPIIGRLYRFYFFKILPRLGTLISGVQGPYKYLPDSVQAFPEPEELKALVAGAGFDDVEYRLFSGGIAVLLLARAREPGVRS
ncbi:MAG: ubiquinone/menaquinone biosynthesis methyltransferase [Acidobacteriia bacterium]|nr:ubiquinone/menaquinone biosynthesis methyltransferase [Terriglobia bacterium]